MWPGWGVTGLLAGPWNGEMQAGRRPSIACQTAEEATAEKMVQMGGRAAQICRKQWLAILAADSPAA